MTLRENLGSTEELGGSRESQVDDMTLPESSALSHVPDIYGGSESTQFERPWPRIYTRAFVNNYDSVRFVRTGICDGIQPASKLRGYR